MHGNVCRSTLPACDERTLAVQALWGSGARHLLGRSAMLLLDKLSLQYLGTSVLFSF